MTCSEMPRTKRTYVPGATAHVICRFVNREYRIQDDRQRADYLRRAARAARRFDWRLLAYAVMSTHIHWVMLAGKLGLDRFTRSVHTGFANWLNALQHREGPLFAGRPKVIQMPVQRTLALLSYVHNNPCRAGIADDPADSSWTSHRYYLGLQAAPPWLDLETGYGLSGIQPGRGRELEFDTYVRAHRADPRDPLLSGDDLEQARRVLRRRVGAVIELGTPFLEQRPDGSPRPRHTLLAPEGARYSERWDGSLGTIIDLSGRYAGVPSHELASRSRKRTVTRARKVAVVAGVAYLRRPLVEVAAALGITSQSASELLRRAQTDEDVVALALQVASSCAGAGAPAAPAPKT